MPGLPPCLGHDLFEGVVATDMVLIIKHLVGQQYFSIDYLNNKIKKFKYVYLGSDQNNKPCTFKSNSDKLNGNAVQN